MAEPISKRFKNAWNAFNGRDPTSEYKYDIGIESYRNPDKMRLNYSNVKTIVAPIYNRMAMDVAQCRFEHIKTNDNGRYEEQMKTGLNNCLNISANKDQTGRNFIQDLMLSVFDEGVVAVYPVDCNVSPYNTESFDILTLRTAKILAWYPDHIRIRIYNDRTGRHEEKVVSKYKTAIIENPFYTVMNETNSAVKRYIHKLALLDKIDEQQGSGKLDIIMQLPYLTRNPRKKAEADARRQELEEQLNASDYGVAWTDGTEKIVQLNRPLENTLSEQVEKLETLILNQLGLSREVFEGTATEEQMQTYYTRAIEPCCAAICDEFTRKFISITGLSQHQKVWYHRDPFALSPVGKVADMADRFTRNEILTPNEFRAIIGYKPSDDAKSDELRNRNISQSSEELAADQNQVPREEKTDE